MKVPSKKPPTTPTVQLLSWAALLSSPAAAAVAAGGRREFGVCALPGADCPLLAAGTAASKSAVTSVSEISRRIVALPSISVGHASGTAEPGQPLLGLRRSQLAGALVPLARLRHVGDEALHLEFAQLVGIVSGTKSHGGKRQASVGRLAEEQPGAGHGTLR